jgi:hypothetical protein
VLILEGAHALSAKLSLCQEHDDPLLSPKGAVIDSIVGVITLGSGESIDSEVLAAALLEPTGEVA